MNYFTTLISECTSNDANKFHSNKLKTPVENNTNTTNTQFYFHLQLLLWWSENGQNQKVDFKLTGFKD